MNGWFNNYEKQGLWQMILYGWVINEKKYNRLKTKSDCKKNPDFAP
jgi:hypothetical protein